MVDAARLAQWLGIATPPETPSPEVVVVLERAIAAATEWAYGQITDTPEVHERALVEEAILIYAARHYQYKDAPAGVIDQDGFQSQGFVSWAALNGLLDLSRVWNIG